MISPGCLVVSDPRIRSTQYAVATNKTNRRRSSADRSKIRLRVSECGLVTRETREDLRQGPVTPHFLYPLAPYCTFALVTFLCLGQGHCGRFCFHGIGKVLNPRTMVKPSAPKIIRGPVANQRQKIDRSEPAETLDESAFSNSASSGHHYIHTVGQLRLSNPETMITMGRPYYMRVPRVDTKRLLQGL